MARDQLQVVLTVESEKEQQLAEQFYHAQQSVTAQQKKLAQLQQYRVDYIEQIKRSGSSCVDASKYQQHLSFVGKLDLACEQQTQQLSRATLVADQRRVNWLQQQQRKKAIEKLIDKKAVHAALRQNRLEQADMDEFANQQFLRRRN